MNVRRAGSGGLLLELATNDEALVVARSLRREAGDLLEDIVPGHRTVLVTAREPDRALEARILQIAAAPTRDGDEATGSETFRVTYDGPDLADVAGAAGMSPEEVVRRHTTSVYAVAFLGFSPGFAYLLGLDPRLQLPRLDTPRTAVRRGSVAIAGPYSAVYPAATPGGWRLIGTTDAVLFDPDRNPPASLTPGMRVRFEAR
jgi:KipI family sensor histidine kinase inhibitor